MAYVSGQLAPSPFVHPITVVWASTLFVSFLVLLGVFMVVGPCRHKAGQAAHHLTMVLVFSYLAYEGVLHYLSGSWEEPTGAHGRIFDRIPGCEVYAPTMLGLQIFDLTVTCVLPGMRKPDAIFHHLLSLVLSASLTHSGVMQYWLAFFFGVLEVSSVPLCFVDFFRAFPAVASNLDAANETVRVLFATSFLPIRCACTPYFVAKWWVDFVTYDAGRACATPPFALRSTEHRGVASGLMRGDHWAGAIRLPSPLIRATPSATSRACVRRLLHAGDEDISANLTLFWTFALVSVMLTLLQFYWGYKVVKAASKMAKGSKEGREKEY